MIFYMSQKLRITLLMVSLPIKWTFLLISNVLWLKFLFVGKTLFTATCKFFRKQEFCPIIFIMQTALCGHSYNLHFNITWTVVLLGQPVISPTTFHLKTNPVKVVKNTLLHSGIKIMSADSQLIITLVLTLIATVRQPATPVFETWWRGVKSLADPFLLLYT